MKSLLRWRRFVLRGRRFTVCGRVSVPLLLLLLSVLGAACGSMAASQGARPVPTSTKATATSGTMAPLLPAATATTDAVGTDVSPALSTPTPSPHPLAVADTDLPDAAVGFDDLFDTVAGPQPVSIAIDNIGVADAPIIPVGVNEDLTLEVPPADEVGWYEFGSAPGEPGSAVLAAHIAYNGVDGVFRYLEDVEVGSVVTVGFDDDTTRQYRITEVNEYVKEALPDSLFAREGTEQLALITCGGTFNPQLDSYESNTVAIAIPL